MSDSTTMTLQTQSLKLNNGSAFNFRGELFAEASWFDDETQNITRQRIYATEDGAQVYSISEGDGEVRENKVYELVTEGENVSISNTQEKLDMPRHMFMSFIRTLIERVDADADPEYTMEHIEELLKAANA